MLDHNCAIIFHNENDKHEALIALKLLGANINMGSVTRMKGIVAYNDCKVLYSFTEHSRCFYEARKGKIKNVTLSELVDFLIK